MGLSLIEADKLPRDRNRRRFAVYKLGCQRAWSPNHFSFQRRLLLWKIICHYANTIKTIALSSNLSNINIIPWRNRRKPVLIFARQTRPCSTEVLITATTIMCSMGQRAIQHTGLQSAAESRYYCRLGAGCAMRILQLADQRCHICATNQIWCRGFARTTRRTYNGKERGNDSALETL